MSEFFIFCPLEFKITLKEFIRFLLPTQNVEIQIIAENSFIILYEDRNSANIQIKFSDLSKCIDGIKNLAMKFEQDILIQKYSLIPHPEGGYFKEMYRSFAPPMESKGKTDERGRLIPTSELPGGQRNEMTSIYWMATSDTFLYMGRNISPHIHYYHNGAPYKYILIDTSGNIEEVVMGPNSEKGHVQQMVVGSNYYKCGYLEEEPYTTLTPNERREMGDYRYTLIGEGVSPGFDFRDFCFVSPQMLEERLNLNSSTSTSQEKIKELLSYLHPDFHNDNFDEFYDFSSNSKVSG